MRSRLPARAIVSLALILATGCGAPEDETLLRFLGFQAAGSSGTGSVSLLEGDLEDGAALKVDASFENQALYLGSAGGGPGILIYRVTIDYALAGFDPPSFSQPVSLYAPAAAAGSKDATGGGTVVLSDIPIVPVSVKQWLIDHDAAGDDGVVEMTADVEFQARTDVGEELTVGGALAVSLGGAGGGNGGATEAVVTVAAETPIAVEGGATGLFRVYRSGNTTSVLSVAYSVSGAAAPGDAAGAGVDYRRLSGTLGISSGSSSGTIVVDAFTDSEVEPGGEAVKITLQSGTGYSVGTPGNATVTILDP